MNQVVNLNYNLRADDKVCNVEIRIYTTTKNDTER